MIAAWIRTFFAYADLSDTTLRASYAALSISGLFARQRAAIAHELAVRAWAEAVEERIGSTIAWCRGGRS